MGHALLVGTRKGLFGFVRENGRWTTNEPQLAGKPIPYAIRDSRDGSIWASLDHGHWGVKLARSTDDGKSFSEAEHTKKAAKYYWVLEPGHAERPEEFWIGTEPGGLFRTKDGGRSWSLVEPLWQMCVEHEWMGGGRDEPGVHSIPHLRRPSRPLLPDRC